MEAALIFAQIIIYLSMLFLTAYGVVVAYHWFSYGASRKTSMSALMIYTSGAILLVLGLFISYSFF